MGKLGDLSPQGSVAVGILVGLVSTSLQAIGLTLQRKSHLLEEQKRPYDVRRPPYKRRRWQLGMAMFVVSNIVGSTIQITTLPLPVLSTLQAVIRSSIQYDIATLILGEPFTRYSFAGTVLVCTGAILIATFGAIGEPAHSLNQLLGLLQRRPFLAWMSTTLVVVAGILVGSRLLGYLLPGARGRPVATGHFTPHLQKLQIRIKLFRGMCYGSVSGILSAHSLLLAKSAVELLLFYLHRGLKLCSTSILYPFVFCIYNIIAILDGLIYFRQVTQLTKLHAGLISLGTIILLGGVLCLSWRLEDVDNHAAVNVVGATQTGLGPGMAVVEEYPPSPGPLDGRFDEETRRDPSFSFLPPADHREAADLNAASIWAELDESDVDVSHSHMRSLSDRPRSSSSGAAFKVPKQRLSRNSTIGPIPYHRTRGSHRVQASASENPWRSTSMPWAGLWGSQRKKRTPWFGQSSNNQEYGTISDDSRQPVHPAGDGPSSSPPSNALLGLITGSRRSLMGAWQSSRQFLSRWTSPRAGNDSESNPHDGSSSPLLPHSDVRIPKTGDTQDPTRGDLTSPQPPSPS
ncbi:Magnesium transporter NIPA [Penicillium chermesinum]|uniref:Magnesium transporter NIPA n=1 Tax=Penicillium chermesinum TaxID=63820 RepID=A0A9W9PKS0_9EURO|nr:Magnesium transporter NIPA [Penicillium chermesinum]KAJ5249225.1 Magnesium transporter NIPA [Penicillium chermesinum]